MTLPTEGDFTSVTTDSRRKRHWSLTRYMERGLHRSLRPGRSGYTLCGGYRSVDQDRLNHDLDLWNAKPVTIADLPPCKQCDKSKARRIDEGRPA